MGERHLSGVMKRRVIYCGSAALVLIGLGSWHWAGRKSSLRLGAGFLRSRAVSSADIRLAAQGNSAFALDLYRQLANSQGNLFFSPYSLSTALAMVYGGARGNTQQQMAGVLHVSLNPEKLHPAFAELQASLAQLQNTDHFTLYVASSLWPQKGYELIGEYLQLMQTCYGVSLTPVDFNEPRQACDTINLWVEERTAAKIEDLITPGVIDSRTRLVLANAVYFKGKWQNPFKRDYTRPVSFYVTPSASVQTPMMMQTERTHYGELGGLQLLELPYVGDHLSLLVLLPNKIDGLKELEASLTLDNLTTWRGLMKRTKVAIFLPRVMMTCQFELAKTFRELGMTDVFDPSCANLGGMTSAERLCVNAVIHKAYVELSEEGTEAAATTAVASRPASRGGRAPRPIPVFRADHPFLFLIQEGRTGSILFIGRVTDPTRA